MTSIPAERYQFKPFPGSSHHWALEQLQKQLPLKAVLDIGCGSGAIGAWLKKQGVEDVHGVEPDSATRSRIKQTYSVLTDCIERVERKDFDVVLLLDVLEHTTDPQTLLDLALARLRPGGTALLSVPNVAHWSVRIPLLFGFFEYTSRAILDRTHYQFFTRRRIRGMLTVRTDAEYVHWSSSISPIELLLPQSLHDNLCMRAFTTLRSAAAVFWPGLFAYQHLAMLKKR